MTKIGGNGGIGEHAVSAATAGNWKAIAKEAKAVGLRDCRTEG
jgi:hypothetical protein